MPLRDAVAATLSTGEVAAQIIPALKLAASPDADVMTFDWLARHVLPLLDPDAAQALANAFERDRTAASMVADTAPELTQHPGWQAILDCIEMGAALPVPTAPEKLDAAGRAKLQEALMVAVVEVTEPVSLVDVDRVIETLIDFNDHLQAHVGGLVHLDAEIDARSVEMIRALLDVADRQKGIREDHTPRRHRGYDS